MMRVAPAARFKSVLLMAPAWIVCVGLMLVAVLMRFPALSYSPTGFWLAIGVAALVSGAGTWLTARALESPACSGRLARRLAWSLALGGFCVVAGRPFIPDPLAFRIAGSLDAGRMIKTKPIEAHGILEKDVADFHATTRPGEVDQPWLYRAEADIRSLTLFGPAALEFRLTQPLWATVDPSTGEQRPESDGVEGRFFVGDDDGWTVFATVTLEPSNRSWQTLGLKVPRGAQRVAIEWFSRQNMNHDVVYAAMLPVRASFPGMPIVVPRLLGEALLVAALLFGLSSLLDLISRRSASSAWGLEPRVMPPTRWSRRARVAGLVVILAVPVPFAIILAPWLDTATTPILLDLEAPVGTKINVRFGDGPDDLARAVRVNETQWTAELPPRKSYRIALAFPDGVAGLTLDRVHLIDTSRREPEYPSRFRSIEPSELRPKDAGLSRTSSLADGRLNVTASAGGELALPGEVFPIHGEHNGLVLWLGGVAALGLAALITTLLLKNGSSRAIYATGPRPLWPLAVTALLIAIFGIAWAVGTPTLVVGDSPAYLKKAISISERGVYDTREIEGEITRLPGYPLFLAGVFNLAGHNLNAVAVFQAILFAFGLFAFSVSLSPFIRTPALVAGMVLAALSPVQQQYIRWVLAESPFVAFSLISLSCWFFSMTAHASARMHWLVAYGVSACVAIFHRPAGLTILTPVFLSWAPTAWALWRSRGTRMHRLASIVRFSVPLAVPVVIVVVSLVGWSYRNKVKTGYFGLSDMGELSILHGHLTTGALDPRIFEKDGVYDDYVTRRFHQTYAWSTFEIRGKFYEQESKAGTGGFGLIAGVGNRFGAMVAADDAVVPWQSRWLRYVRSAWYLLRAASVQDYIGAWKWPEYHRWVYGPVETSEAIKKKLLAVAGCQFGSNDVQMGPMVAAIIETTGWTVRPGYPLIHFPLFVLALVAALTLLHRGLPVLAAPFGIVLSTYLLLLLLMQHDARYMEIMDVLMFFQCLIAVGVRRDAVAPSASIPEAGTPLIS